VLDRFIQQCLLQVLQPQFDPTFSEHSYGFRPGRSAHDAVRAAQRYIQSGRRWVADVDLAKFFDRVNHDVLMERLSRRAADDAMTTLKRLFTRLRLQVNEAKSTVARAANASSSATASGWLRGEWSDRASHRSPSRK
jgi:retron-type reverse transcriptase